MGVDLKIIFFIFLSFSLLFGKCYYVPCNAGVSQATSDVVRELNNKFSDIESKLDKIDNLYKDKKKAIDENNLLYEKIILLKKIYFLRLQEINFEIEKQKKIGSLSDDK